MNGAVSPSPSMLDGSRGTAGDMPCSRSRRRREYCLGAAGRLGAQGGERGSATAALADGAAMRFRGKLGHH